MNTQDNSKEGELLEISPTQDQLDIIKDSLALGSKLAGVLQIQNCFSCTLKKATQIYDHYKEQKELGAFTQYQQLQDENKALKGLIKRQNAELWETICDLRGLKAQDRLNEQGIKRLADCVKLYEESIK